MERITHRAVGEGLEEDAQKVLAQYIGDRRPDPNKDTIQAGSIEAVEDMLATAERDLSSGTMPNLQRTKTLTVGITTRNILSLTRNRVHTFLVAAERELQFTASGTDMLHQREAELATFLGTAAPDLLDRFNVVFARLAEADGLEQGTHVDELLAQSVTSCRRILKAVVDIVQPVDASRKKSSNGEHDLTDAQYKNRLYEFFKSKQTGSYLDAHVASLNSLWQRFAAIDTLANKGVHAAVARNEAEFCALNTYLLSTEVLRMA